MNSFYVYMWTRPDTGEVFYVGKGSGARDTSLARRSRHFMAVVDKVRSLGMEPTVCRIATDLSEQQAFDLERSEIGRIGRSDLGLGPLVNKTDGGDGSSGVVKSAASRRKLSASLMKLFEDPLERQKRSVANLRRYSDPAERAKASAALIRSYASDPGRGQRHADALRSHYSDPDNRAKVSLANLARYRDQGARERLSRARHMAPPGAKNKSGFKGVSFVKDDETWLAQISVGGVRRRIGTYPTKEFAAKAYDEAAYAAWGTDCYLNFPERFSAAA